MTSILLDVAQSEAHFARKPASNLGNLTKSCASTPVEVAHTDAQGSCGVALKEHARLLHELRNYEQTQRRIIFSK
jgi:hypothetical protein